MFRPSLGWLPPRVPNPYRRRGHSSTIYVTLTQIPHHSVGMATRWWITLSELSSLFYGLQKGTKVETQRRPKLVSQVPTVSAIFLSTTCNTFASLLPIFSLSMLRRAARFPAENSCSYPQLQSSRLRSLYHSQDWQSPRK